MIKPLIIETVHGEVERLTDHSVQFTQSIETHKSISVQIRKTDANAHSYPLVKNLNWFLYEGDYYNITNCSERVKGKYLVKEMQGMIKWIWDLNGKRIREVLNGHIRPKAMLEFILKDTGYNFVLDETGLETSVEVENFGNDRVKDLLSSFKDKFNVEISCVEQTIYIAKSIGRDTEAILKDRFNITDIVQSMETTEFCTYIRGWGAEKENEDEDAPVEYVVQGEYVSPLEKIYPRREAPWVDDRRFHVQAALNEEMKRRVNDSLDISLTLTAKQLEEMDITNLECGDWLWCFVDPYDIDVKIRVVEIQNNQDPDSSPVLTLGTIKSRMTQRFKNYENTSNVIGKVFDLTRGQIKPSAIDTRNIPINLSKAKGFLPVEKVTGLNIPQYGRATAINDGLMPSDHFVKVEQLTIDENGNISIPLADAFSDGLLSSDLFSKLDGLVVNPDGTVFVDLTAIENQLLDFERRLKNLESRN